MTETTERLEAIARAYINDGHFRPEEVELDSASIPRLTKFDGNPIRFLPKMFDGDWEVRGVHPVEGQGRVLRVIVDSTDMVRVILRQGPRLFIYTAVPLEEDQEC